MDCDAPYFRLKESYRDELGRIRTPTLLNIGFDATVTPQEVRRIASALTTRRNNGGQATLFGPNDNTPVGTVTCARAKAEEWWARMQTEGSIDRVEAERYVDLDTVEHTDARHVGAEWLCKQAIDQLRLEDFLRREGWEEGDIHTVLAHTVLVTVYASSHLAAHRIMRDNSAAAELYAGRPGWTPGLNALL